MSVMSRTKAREIALHLILRWGSSSLKKKT